MGQVRRRQFLFASSALLATQLARSQLAQKTERARRIGCLSVGSGGKWLQRTLRTQLRRVGYEEGKNILIEWRWADGKAENLPALAADLVEHKVELIVAFLNDAIVAAKQVTHTIPVVMLYGFLPVELGLIASLQRPGGNVTGTAYFGIETMAKLLELLKEVKPSTRRVTVLRNPLFPGVRLAQPILDRAAASLEIRLEYIDATRPELVPSALIRVAASRPDAFIFSRDEVLAFRNLEISAFAREHKLASIGTAPDWVEDGGLLSYTPDIDDVFRRTVSYIDQILRGANPAHLPVEEPSRYEFAINLKTAKALGLTIPPSVLLRADRVIE